MTKKVIKVTAKDVPDIRVGVWVVDAQWYESTSADQERKSYKLLEGVTVHIPVASLIQESEITFDREFREESILSPASHLAITRAANFTNVTA